jgi:hypothetical protein
MLLNGEHEEALSGRFSTDTKPASEILHYVQDDRGLFWVLKYEQTSLRKAKLPGESNRSTLQIPP